MERAGFVRIALSGGSPELRERALAEAFEAGALGVEECDGPPPRLWIHAGAGDAGRILAAVAPFAELRVGEPEALPDRAWSEAWKEGLEAIVVSPRLAVRPSFAAAPAGFTGVELVVDPGQAFGTGGHASTRLALEAIAALRTLPGARVLDVGCGTGVLALGALALGAARAVGCDVDPLATAAAREAAAANGLAGRLSLYTGSLDALGAPAESAFDLVVANLLRRELEPLIAEFARLVRPRGTVILSGLLASERGRIEPALARARLRIEAARTARDPSGDTWLALSLGPGRS